MNPLVETWQISARINLYLLEALSVEQLKVAVHKGKSVGAQFAHIHNVRLMWLKASAEDLFSGQAKLEGKDFDSDILSSRLKESAEAISILVATSIETGRIKNFKPHPSAFVGYLISHEAHHRGQIEIGLRQAGCPISDKTGYGLWEWGVR